MLEAICLNKTELQWSFVQGSDERCNAYESIEILVIGLLLSAIRLQSVVFFFVDTMHLVNQFSIFSGERS